MTTENGQQQPKKRPTQTFPRGDYTLMIVGEDDTKNQEECFKLRYEVYTLDNGWEPENPEKMETDDWDKVNPTTGKCPSVSGLILYKGEPVASVRLVFKEPGSDAKLPMDDTFEKHMGKTDKDGRTFDPTVYATIMQNLGEHKKPVAEVSRLCIPKRILAAANNGYGASQISKLLLTVVQYIASSHDTEHMVAIMVPALAKGILGRQGLKMTNVCDDFMLNHKGYRTGFYFCTTDYIDYNYKHGMKEAREAAPAVENPDVPRGLERILFTINYGKDADGKENYKFAPPSYREYFANMNAYQEVISTFGPGVVQETNYGDVGKPTWLQSQVPDSSGVYPQTDFGNTDIMRALHPSPTATPVAAPSDVIAIKGIDADDLGKLTERHALSVEQAQRPGSRTVTKKLVLS